MFSPCAAVVFVAGAASHPLEHCELSVFRLPRGVRGKCSHHAPRWYLSQGRPPALWNAVTSRCCGSPRGSEGDVLTMRRGGICRRGGRVRPSVDLPDEPWDPVGSIQLPPRHIPSKTARAVFPSRYLPLSSPHDRGRAAAKWPGATPTARFPRSEWYPPEGIRQVVVRGACHGCASRPSSEWYPPEGIRQVVVVFPGGNSVDP